MSSLIQAGLNVTAIGMGVVFVLLTLLVFIIRGMSALALKFAGPETQAGDVSAMPVPPFSSPNQQLVSVISAAVAAHRKRR